MTRNGKNIKKNIELELILLFAIIMIMGYIMLSCLNINEFVSISYKKQPIFNYSRILVDNENDIYISNELFNEIQIYDSEGNYQHSIRVNSIRTLQDIYLDGNDTLRVVLYEQEKVFVIDKDGSLIDEYVFDYQSEFDEYTKDKYYLEKQDGTKYKVCSILFYQAVYRISEGTTKKVFGANLFEFLVSLMVFYFVFLLFVEAKFSRRRKTNTKKVQRKLVDINETIRIGMGIIDLNFIEYYKNITIDKGFFKEKKSFSEEKFKNYQISRVLWIFTMFLIFTYENIKDLEVLYSGWGFAIHFVLFLFALIVLLFLMDVTYCWERFKLHCYRTAVSRG